MKVQFSDDELRTMINDHPKLTLDEQASDTDSSEERTFELHETDSAETDSEDLVTDHKAWEGDGRYL